MLTNAGLENIIVRENPCIKLKIKMHHTEVSPQARGPLVSLGLSIYITLK